MNLLERQLDAASESSRKRELLLQIAGVWEKNIQNKFEARDWYEQALTLWPGCEEAQAGLARLEGGADGASEDDRAEEEEDEGIKKLISIPPPPVEPAEGAGNEGASSDVADSVAETAAIAREEKEEEAPAEEAEPAPSSQKHISFMPPPADEGEPEPEPSLSLGDVEIDSDSFGVEAAGLIESEEEIVADDLVTEVALDDAKPSEPDEEDVQSLDDLVDLEENEDENKNEKKKKSKNKTKKS